MTIPWPAAAQELLKELRAGRGVLALVGVGAGAGAGAGAGVDAGELLAALGAVVAGVIDVGQCFAQSEAPEAILHRLDVSDESLLLTNIEPLFTPQIGVEVIVLLRQLAQRRPVVAAWPGQIADGRLSYSLPGRFDHVDEPARDLVVLRPTQAVFPDEVPYTVERYPA